MELDVLGNHKEKNKKNKKNKKIKK